ncbi:MAG TPA: hypothetical protein VHQ20_02315 [Patescibacteria group bacterium]|jgi:hypothetical protein|nr:hypothetical protein [Patescibacteria group bacterium]
MTTAAAALSQQEEKTAEQDQELIEKLCIESGRKANDCQFCITDEDHRVGTHRYGYAGV